MQQDDKADEENPTAVELSPIAREIARVHKLTIESAEKRERLPQPLFWSLFHARIAAVRRDKELARLLTSILK